MNKLVILRGLPGSGKSHYVDELASEEDLVDASADDYPGLYTEEDGKVKINVALLDEAHGACMLSAIEGLTNKVTVVIDNTNLSAEECIPYVALAQAFRVPCEIVTVLCDPDVAFARQAHGVPREAFDAMIGRMESFTSPQHWAFFSWLSHRQVSKA